MTGDVINLRLARKNKARSDAEKRAEENRAKFGRSKTEKTLSDAVKNLAEKTLDGSKREP